MLTNVKPLPYTRSGRSPTTRVRGRPHLPGRVQGPHQLDLRGHRRRHHLLQSARQRVYPADPRRQIGQRQRRQQAQSGLRPIRVRRRQRQNPRHRFRRTATPQIVTRPQQACPAMSRTAIRPHVQPVGDVIGKTVVGRVAKRTGMLEDDEQRVRGTGHHRGGCRCRSGPRRIWKSWSSRDSCPTDPLRVAGERQAGQLERGRRAAGPERAARPGRGRQRPDLLRRAASIEELLEFATYDLDTLLQAGIIVDGSGYPVDSLVSEWGYLIDLDTATFEVYRGFQNQAHTAGRFAHRPPAHENYYPVALVASWPLADLPDRASFLALPAPTNRAGRRTSPHIPLTSATDHQERQRAPQGQPDPPGWSRPPERASTCRR
jgi:hypothetical protein